MEQVVIASSEADAQAAEAVERHHAELAGGLEALVRALVSAATAGEHERAEQARSGLLHWCEQELLPHAAAEEKSLYPAAHARTEGRLLVDAMVTEHHELTGLVRELGATDDPVLAAATATALRVHFAGHVRKENELVLPMLSAAPEVRLAELLDAMHDQIAADEAGERGTESEPSGHTCGCGEALEDGFPELDARVIPHAIRHATIFGALDTVPAGGGLILLAPHDPLPLLAQVEERYAGRFEVSYLERGPENWRLSFVRRAAHG